MKKIAVICAFNPRNSGMYSVDLGGLDFFSSLHCDFDFFLAQTQIKGAGKLAKIIPNRFLYPEKYRFGKLNFKRLDNISDLIRDYDYVVYWGDFLNNPLYGKFDFAYRDFCAGRVATQTEGYRRWKKLFCPDISTGPKLVSIGNNFQHDFSIENEDYEEVVLKILHNFYIVAPRDHYSFENLNKYIVSKAKSDKNPSQSLFKGVDCAFFINDTERRKNSTKTFTYFFHRSGFNSTKYLIKLLEKQTDLKGVETSHWLNLNKRNADNEFNSNLSLILNSQFVITDTYHVCVNALRMGVPTICLSQDSHSQKGTLGDFKKRQLFEMFNARSYYYTLLPSQDEKEFYDSIVNTIEEKIAEEFSSFEVVRHTVTKKVRETKNIITSMLFDNG
ncbi:polysaccharide pyruvyl transferase family protein [Alteromonas oceani]|uniref:Polysaccharide pyruvyl transferase family protein n=1 Tax=Alteromonas oceani TaxID=2071609 RepID=A0ABV7K5T8_9ALTE|nr:polysaccharide pyruvyl transferase family protein [Alteromonas oceani]